MKNKNLTWMQVGTTLLALAMALGLASCGKKEDQPSSPTTEAPSTEDGTTSGGEEALTPNYSGKTYENSDFKILIRKDDLYANDLSILRYDTSSTELDKKVYYRNIDVEKKMGVMLTYVTDDSEKIQSAVKNAVAGNIPDAYDLVVNQGMSVFHGAESGYYLDWYALPTVNLDAPWWSQNIKDAWKSPSGKLYAANGDISYLSIGSANCMYFNKDLIATAQATSPYTYVSENNWTFETFFQSAREVGATISDNGGVGYLCQINRGPVDAIYATGNSTIVLNENKSYSIGIQNEQTYKAFDAYVDFLKGGSAKLVDDLNQARKQFTQAQAVYFDDNIYVSASTFQDVDFGILPFPKSDSEVEHYQSLVGAGTNTFAILANTTDANRQRIGDVVECLAYIGYTDVVPFYFDTLVTKQSIKDPESLKSLEIIRSSLIFDLGHYLNPGGIYNVPIDVVNEKSSSLSTALETISLGGTIDAALANWLTK